VPFLDPHAREQEAQVQVQVQVQVMPGSHAAARVRLCRACPCETNGDFVPRACLCVVWPSGRRRGAMSDCLRRWFCLACTPCRVPIHCPFPYVHSCIHPCACLSSSYDKFAARGDVQTKTVFAVVKASGVASNPVLARVRLVVMLLVFSRLDGLVALCVLKQAAVGCWDASKLFTVRVVCGVWCVVVVVVVCVCVCVCVCDGFTRCVVSRKPPTEGGQPAP